MFCGANVCAQTPQEVEQEKQSAAGKTAADGDIVTRPDARAITLKIPAPRGLIVDREGKPIAQNEVVCQVGLQFGQFEKADRDFVVSWARTRLAALAPMVKSIVNFSDDQLVSHYSERRWLPLLVSGHISGKDAQALEKNLPSGLVMVPLYRRIYPNGELGAHIVGYTGSVGKLPTGPINFNEPMWEETEGRAGFEQLFEQELTGEPGVKKLLFDEAGNKLQEEQVKRPRPGGTLVTTLNLEWQRLAEKTLRNGCRRGAFVVIDVITGEVLVMASRPSFDLNAFIPSISEKEFKGLQEDKSQPLFGRAFQSAYPPASAFKPVVALAALNNGTITQHSTIYSPAQLTIGRTVFRNWSKTPEGSIDVERALARSCNTWFYQVGIDVGPSAFLGLARRLGFGERSSLPLVGETPGLVPNDEWMLKHEKRRILNGDTANLSIGQGVLLSSPLQVAQAMAGIANGGALPRLQLIRQIQDSRGRVIKAFVPERKTWLGLDSKAVDIVHHGMSDVVNKGYGTGKSAALSYTSLCGKTGTAQWGPKAKNQRLAWFAGFLPRENPRYAFAVLYEGRPGEKVSGGRMAAPMVRKFFEGIKEDIKETIAPPKRALIVGADDGAGETKRAIPVEEAPADDWESGPDPDITAAGIAGAEGGVSAGDAPVSDGEISDVGNDTAAAAGDAESPPRAAIPIEEDDEVMDENVESPEP